MAWCKPSRRRPADKLISRRVDRLVSRLPEVSYLCVSGAFARHRHHRGLRSVSVPRSRHPVREHVRHDQRGLPVRLAYNEYRIGCEVPARGTCVVDVGRVDPSDSSSLAPRPQSVHTISQPLHSLYTPRCCRPRRPSPRVSALWARRRFMTSCVVSESTSMSRPPGLTHSWSVTPANTLCWLARRFRPRCSDQVQRLISTQTGTISCRHPRRVSPQVTGHGRSRCGARGQPVRW